MNITDVLRNVKRLFLDTAPVIYYVEKNPSYFDSVKAIFDRIDSDLLTAVTSPVTLAECLVIPCHASSIQLQEDFFDLIVHGRNTLFVPIDEQSGRRAAELRARYNLTLTDSLQISVALGAGCELFLTNDTGLKRVVELRVLVLAEVFQ